MLLNESPTPVNLSSAVICLNMGKGNEKLNQYLGTLNLQPPRKQMLCELNRLVCVYWTFLFSARHWIERRRETMERWGGEQCCTLAKRS